MNFRMQMVATCAAALLIPAGVLAADKEATPAKPVAAKQTEARKSAACTPTTGTRIRPRKERDCDVSKANSPARSFTAEELQQTSYTDLAEVLRSLTPVVR